MELTMFTKAVLEATKKVPRGRITAYSEIAKVIGRPKAARAVGNALNKNPYSPVVPMPSGSKEQWLFGWV